MDDNLTVQCARWTATSKRRGESEYSNEASRLKLERATELSKGRFSKAQRDTAGLFNAGLCHWFLSATASGPSSSSSSPRDSKDYTNAAQLYQKPWAMFERLLEVHPESRAARFNYGLSYMSPALLKQDKVNGDNKNDERWSESSVDKKMRTWMQQALLPFEKTLAQKRRCQSNGL